MESNTDKMIDFYSQQIQKNENLIQEEKDELKRKELIRNQKLYMETLNHYINIKKEGLKGKTKANCSRITLGKHLTKEKQNQIHKNRNKYQNKKQFICKSKEEYYLYKRVKLSKNTIQLKCRTESCPGRASFNLLSKRISIRIPCDLDIKHKLNEEFKIFQLLKNNKHDNIRDIEKESTQKYIFKFIYQNKNIKDLAKGVEQWYKYFPNIQIQLNESDISKIRYNIQGKKHKESIQECLDSLKNNNPNLEIEYLSYDFIHSKKGKQSIYFVFSKEMLNYLSNEQNEILQYFVDTTFKIVPYCFRPYKMHVLLGFSLKKLYSVICCFVLYSLMDTETYSKIYLFMNKTFNFNPHIVVCDFQLSNINALKIVFPEGKRCSCFFHFSQSIKKEVDSIFKFKKRGRETKDEIALKEKVKEMIVNIKYLCFLPLDEVLSFYNKICHEYKGEKFKEFFQYFSNQWIKKVKPKLWNYNTFINANKKIINLLYLTNNVCESFNSLLNSYISHRRTSAEDFKTSISNCINKNKNKLSISYRKNNLSNLYVKYLFSNEEGKNPNLIRRADFIKFANNIKCDNEENFNDVINTHPELQDNARDDNEADECKENITISAHSLSESFNDEEEIKSNSEDSEEKIYEEEKTREIKRKMKVVQNLGKDEDDTVIKIDRGDSIISYNKNKPTKRKILIKKNKINRLNQK